MAIGRAGLDKGIQVTFDHTQTRVTWSNMVKSNN